MRDRTAKRDQDQRLGSCCTPSDSIPQHMCLCRPGLTPDRSDAGACHSEPFAHLASFLATPLQQSPNHPSHHPRLGGPLTLPYDSGSPAAASRRGIGSGSGPASRLALGRSQNTALRIGNIRPCRGVDTGDGESSHARVAVVREQRQGRQANRRGPVQANGSLVGKYLLGARMTGGVRVSRISSTTRVAGAMKTTVAPRQEDHPLWWPF